MDNKHLFVCGDLHFETNHDWSQEAFHKFISWFENYNFGDYNQSELLQLGDVVEKATNTGATLELVSLFFDIACKKFSKIYVLGGNHCHRLTKEKSQYATQFLKFIGTHHSKGDVSQIEVIYDEKIFFTSNHFQIIALPYKRINGKILDDYYTKELPPEFYSTKADLICGHVAIKEPKTFYGGIDITKFATTNYAFGHIHTRNGLYKKYYTGSVLPFKIDEENTELERCIKVFTKSNAQITEQEIQIPRFITYEKVKFEDQPTFKKESDNQVHIYTVTNCKNIQQAKNFYPDYYIRGVEKINTNITVHAGEKEKIFLTPLEALDSMLKETKMTIKRKTLSLLKTILS
jgi:DNA repair exonuclease SbcCD nuclease subunit